MLRKTVAASVVAVWLVLAGVDIAGDMGWIPNRSVENDVCVDGALSDLGEAINNSGDSQFATAYLLCTYAEASSLYTPQSPSIDSDTFDHLQTQTPINVERFKGHNFLQVFLI